MSYDLFYGPVISGTGMKHRKKSSSGRSRNFAAVFTLSGRARKEGGGVDGGCGFAVSAVPT